MSDPHLTLCPACNKPGLKRQLTAAGFQLKGSGWYVTDFKNNNSAGGKKPASPEQGTGAKAGDSAGSSTAGGAGAAESSGSASAAPAPSPTPAATAASTPIPKTP